MSAEVHDAGMLAARAFGVLPREETDALDAHLATCEACRTELDELRQTVQALDEAPPELMLDGPPTGGDLVLQRALQTVRSEARGRTARRRILVAVAAAVGVLVAGTAGVAVERARLQRDVLVATPPVVTVPGQPPGTRYGSAVDPQTNARITVAVVPAVGWVRLSAAVTGIAAGEPCQLWLLARDGSRRAAGGWLVSERGAQEGTTLEETVLVDPADVTGVEVRNTSGKKFVSVRL